MKILTSLFVFCLLSANANAQKFDEETLRGTWEFNTEKSKVSYKFDLEKKFNAVTVRNENEMKSQGTYEIDKIGDQDRIKLMTKHPSNVTKTQITYHLVKFVGKDSIKVQSVSSKQNTWMPETKKNTMLFVRKKEKQKE